MLRQMFVLFFSNMHFSFFKGSFTLSKSKAESDGHHKIGNNLKLFQTYC